MIKYLALRLIKIYQMTLSPDHGPLKYFFPNGACIYRPSCSEYTYDAIKKYGIIKGVLIGTRRIVRCHPWHEGGEDPLK